MATIEWSVGASSDLDSIRANLDRRSSRFSESFVNRLLEAVDRLAGFPRMGRSLPKLGMNSVRELVFQNYRIVYYIRPERVIILGVFAASMDMSSRLAPRLWDIT